MFKVGDNVKLNKDGVSIMQVRGIVKTDLVNGTVEDIEIVKPWGEGEKTIVVFIRPGRKEPYRVNSRYLELAQDGR